MSRDLLLRPPVPLAASVLQRAAVRAGGLCRDPHGERALRRAGTPRKPCHPPSPADAPVPQVCALVRCAAADASSCGLEVEEAQSRLDFALEGRFGSPFVYPSVLASGMVLEQPERVRAQADGRVRLKHSNGTGGLVAACLYGRMYHLDAA